MIDFTVLAKRSISRVVKSKTNWCEIFSKSTCSISQKQHKVLKPSNKYDPQHDLSNSFHRNEFGEFSHNSNVVLKKIVISILNSNCALSSIVEFFFFLIIF